MAKFDFLKKLPFNAPVSSTERKLAIEAEERAALEAQGLLEPEVLGTGISKALPKASIIEEADVLSPKLNNVDLPANEQLQKLNKLKAGLAAIGAGGAGAAGVYALNQNQSSLPEEIIVPPQASEAPKIQTAPASYAQPVESSDTEKVLEQLRAKLSKPSSSETIKPLVKDIDFGETNAIASLNALKDAQNRSNDAVFANSLARAGAAFSTGASGIENKFDPIIADQIKQAKEIPNQYLEQVKFEKEDPNSAMSKGYRDIAKSMGFNIKGSASAADLERLMPQLANIYNQQEAQLARAQSAKENREARRDELELRLALSKETKDKELQSKNEDKKNKFISDAQKVMSKEFEKLQKVENAFDGIEQAKDDKMGAADVSILYNFIKSQDPESVVREGEIALGQRGMSLAGRLRTMTLGQLSGELLDPKFRNDVLKISRRLKDQGYTSYGQAVQTVRDTAKQRYGMTDDELTLIDPDLNRQKKKREQAASGETQTTPASSSKVVVKKGYNSQTNQTQLIYSDGTKEIVNGRR